MGGAFVGHIAKPLRQRFVYFYARVLIVYDYSSSGQAIFNKSVARVKGDVSVKCILKGGIGSWTCIGHFVQLTNSSNTR